MTGHQVGEQANANWRSAVSTQLTDRNCAHLGGPIDRSGSAKVGWETGHWLIEDARRIRLISRVMQQLKVLDQPLSAHR
jgi:hypothetical protein